MQKLSGRYGLSVEYAVEAVVIRNVPCSSCPAASTLCILYTCNTYLYVLEYIQVYARDNVGWGLCAMWRRLLEENLRLGTASAVLAGTHLFLVKVSLPCGGTNPTTLILPLAYPHVNLIDRRA